MHSGITFRVCFVRQVKSQAGFRFIRTVTQQAVFTQQGLNIAAENRGLVVCIRRRMHNDRTDTKDGGDESVSAENRHRVFRCLSVQKFLRAKPVSGMVWPG